MSHEESVDIEDAVDPRVQVELERLNAATDEINRLEVELDECRNHFRLLLSESTARIESCLKKLGPCIEKARPYYDSRLKAKAALRETQKVASKYERANSAHAAAKEMVFLAEEGLKAEGRTFDHAWQEMLNHATMRVNESEAERTACEAEHKQTSQLYQAAENRVQTLQRDLKRVISKSRPYFELKIHCNQILEEQKKKVKTLEKQITDTKLGYAETLRNLEQISDEIHQTRQYNKLKNQQKTGTESNESGTFSNKENEKTFAESSPHKYNDLTKESTTDVPIDRGVAKMTPTSGSSIPDTDIWSETSENRTNEGTLSPHSPRSVNDSSMTGLPDSDSDEDALKPDESRASHSPVTPPSISNLTCAEQSQNVLPFTDGIGICSFPVESELNVAFQHSNEEPSSNWTEISLYSPKETTFPTMKKCTNVREDDFDIPYAPLSEIELDPSTTSHDIIESPITPQQTNGSTSWGKISGTDKNEEGNENKMVVTPGKKSGLRRQSLDVIFSSATGEKMKEILSQGMLKLNIGALNERRCSESKIAEELPECREMDEQKGTTAYEANLSSQFGLQFFSKKGKTDEESKPEETKPVENQESISNQLGGLLSRKEKFFTRKVPNPLERTLSFLNADDDSTSDTESLPSVDMLTDEQLSVLVLDRDLNEIYHDILQ